MTGISRNLPNPNVSLNAELNVSSKKNPNLVESQNKVKESSSACSNHAMDNCSIPKRDSEKSNSLQTKASRVSSRSAVSQATQEYNKARREIRKEIGNETYKMMRSDTQLKVELKEMIKQRQDRNTTQSPGEFSNNLINLSVRHKNIPIDSSERGKFQQDCKQAIQEGEKILQSIPAPSQKQSEEIQQGMVALGLMMGKQRLGFLNENQTRCLGIILPYAQGKTHAEKKISEQDLRTLANVVAKMDSNEIKELYKEVSLQNFASSDPYPITPYVLRRYLETAGLKEEMSVAVREQETPLATQLDKLEEAYKLSERNLTEKAEFDKMRYTEGKNDIFNLISVLRPIIGTDLSDIHTDLDNALSLCENSINTSSNPQEKSQYIKDLNETVEPIFDRLALALNRKIKEAAPELSELHLKKLALQEEGQQLESELANNPTPENRDKLELQLKENQAKISANTRERGLFNMKGNPQLNELTQNIKSQFPMYNTPAFASKPDGHALAKITAHIGSDSLKGGLAELLKETVKSEAALEEFNKSKG